MISAALGKRYERLLFLTAPISLAAIIVCLVAIASTKQKERVEARCYSQAANVFSEHLSKLESDWTSTKKKDEFWLLDYKLRISKIWIYGSHINECYDTIDKQIDAGIFKQSPAKMIDDLKAKADQLGQTPLSIYGISLPKQATIDLFVTEFKVDFLTLTRIMQVVLLPIIMLWLGSLYATRYRESLTTSEATSLAEVFPHIINIYPAFDQPSPRKRDPLAPYAKGIASFVYAMTRIALLSLFLAPPILAYLYSLYIVANEQFVFLPFIAGITVSLFALTTLVAELLPTHYRKIFPDPIKQMRL